MSGRRILLIAMLTVLAACAVAGVFAVFTGSSDATWRVVGTAIDTIVATGMLLPLSLLASRPKLRIGGLVGMVVILVSWMCVLGLIWGSDFLGGWRGEQMLVMSLGFTLLMGLPTAGVLLLVSLKWARWAVWVFLQVACAAYVLCEFAALTEMTGWDRSGRFAGSGMALYGIGTCCAALLVNLGCGDRRYFRWAGLVCGAVALTLGEFGIWAEINNALLLRTFVVVLSTCIVMAHANLLLMARMRPTQIWLRWATIIVSALGGAGASAAGLMDGSGDTAEFFIRASAAAGIAAACGSLAIVVLSALNRKIDEQAGAIGALDATEITLLCPRCGVRQAVPLGDSTCKNCQLQIFVKVTEPRCPVCGYLLYRLTTPRCPECGTPVRPATADLPAAGPVPATVPATPAPTADAGI